MNKKIEEFIENHCVERRLIPKGKDCDEHMSYWLVVSREDLNKLITSAVSEKDVLIAILEQEVDNWKNVFVEEAVEEEQERCAKIVEDSTLITDSLLLRHKAVKELQFEIAKAIRSE